MKRLMQGDSYNIPIHIKASDGTVMTKQSVIRVEIVIGCLKKCFPGEKTFSDGAWLFPVSQEESLSIAALPPGQQNKFLTDEVMAVLAKYGVE